MYNVSVGTNTRVHGFCCVAIGDNLMVRGAYKVKVGDKITIPETTTKVQAVNILAELHELKLTYLELSKDGQAPKFFGDEAKHALELLETAIEDHFRLRKSELIADVEAAVATNSQKPQNNRTGPKKKYYKKPRPGPAD